MNRSRRDFLKLGAAAGAATMVGRHSVASTFRSAAQVNAFRGIEPFPLGAVRLSKGIFHTQADINAKYLESLDVDRLLHTFRLTAGLPTTAKPYGGWELPDCELRGHFAGGHYLSAVALAYAGSGNAELKNRGDALVAGLAACQKKMANNGYLSAYPATLFEKLAAGQPVWAPFYTYHKIMAGLLDMYLHTGNTEALAIAEGMAHWAGDYFYGISNEQRQRMLRTEYGGMNEVLVNLAAVTKKDRYLDTAHLFEQPSILDPLAARRDELQGLHANTNVPKIIGAARMYEVTGERRYREIAEYFIDDVLRQRSYVIGNMSVGEHWTTPAGQLKGTLEWSNAECCVAYNLMKLERLVFGWTGDARWMDAYERSLLNCRLGTQNPEGLKEYFFPLAAGYWRAYGSADESFWCCTGTGAEEFAKLTDTIYFRRDGDVFVNQFIASTLDWKDEKFGIEQKTNFPAEQGTTLKISTPNPQMRAIHMRIPGWTTDAAQVKINGHALEAMAEPGSYLTIKRTWQDGDIITLSLPMELRQETLLGDDNTIAALYGPMVLATDMGAGPTEGPQKVIHGRGTEPEGKPKPNALPKVHIANRESGTSAADWVQVSSASDLRFKAAGANGEIALLPLYQITEQKYAVYFDAGGEAKA